MIRLVVSIDIIFEKREEFLKIIKILVKESKKEDGCLEYFCVETDVKNFFYIIELWRDEKSLTKHNESEHFKKYALKINSLKDKSLTINKYLIEEDRSIPK